jgi:hypothetical protein
MRLCARNSDVEKRNKKIKNRNTLRINKIQKIDNSVKMHFRGALLIFKIADLN